MRLITYRSDRGPRVAAAHGEGWVDLNDADPSLPSCIKRFLALGEEGRARAAEALRKSTSLGMVPADGLRLLAPVPDPLKIICVGLNYADHARETGMAAPPEPVIFNKLPSAIIGPDDPIVLPSLSAEVDYEAELVVVIGRGGRYIPVERVGEHIGGYCCGNDISARDWQFRKPGTQWLLGKSFDTFAPIGPAIVTPDEVAEPGDLEIQLRLNGRVMQQSCTREFIFSIEQLIAYVSQVCALAPGDLIFTGTPSGVGMAMKPPSFLKPGDSVEVEIEGVGLLCNPVVDETAMRGDRQGAA